MTANKRKPTTRPVFLTAAIQRIRKQPSRGRFWRASRALFSAVLSDAKFWLTEGLWQVPPTLKCGAKRWSLPIDDSSHSPQVDLYLPELSNLKDEQSLPKTTVLYVHGGAWGAGDSKYYSQLGTHIANVTRARVLILSYDLYPKAGMDEQAEAVEKALLRIRNRSSRTILLAHSSGAQISALALLRHAEKYPEETPLASVAIFTAGPFDLAHHFLYESGRGVAEVSPMLPAAYADEDISNFDHFSPSTIAEKLQARLQEFPDLPSEPQCLEGKIAGSNIWLPDIGEQQKAKTKEEPGKALSNFPRTYILTSSCDTVVPAYSSIRFAAALRKLGVPAHLLVYDFMEHLHFVTDWFRGTKSRDLSDLLDVGVEEIERRRACTTHLKGEAYAGIYKESFLEWGPTPYVRDVLRIISGLTMDKKLYPENNY